jgi:hypothetical protein
MPNNDKHTIDLTVNKQKKQQAEEKELNYTS